MGTTKHHTIIVTGVDEAINRAHDAATSTFKELVSPIIKSKMNGYMSFFIAPDGSKEGWKDSNEYDDKRKNYIAWLEDEINELGNYLDYAEICYSSDIIPNILNHS